MPDKVIKYETVMRTNGGPQTTVTYRCSRCPSGQVRRRGKSLKAGDTLLCPSCVQQKRPYESIYRGLFNDHRGTDVHLTYDEYLEFTEQTECTYCADIIPWVPYGTVNGRFKSRAYFLDRKDHNIGYTRTNCVVCCTSCNRMRSNKFTFDEFVEIGKVLKNLWARRARQEKEYVDVCDLSRGGTCGS